MPVTNGGYKDSAEAAMNAKGSKPTEQEIRDKIAAIDADERFHYPAATIFENGPLALIQMEMEAQAAALAWVLGIKPLKSRRGKER